MSETIDVASAMIKAHCHFRQVMYISDVSLSSADLHGRRSFCVLTTIE